jgi:hypothetical protein
VRSLVFVPSDISDHHSFTEDRIRDLLELFGKTSDDRGDGLLSALTRGRPVGLAESARKMGHIIESPRECDLCYGTLLMSRVR